MKLTTFPPMLKVSRTSWTFFARVCVSVVAPNDSFVGASKRLTGGKNVRPLNFLRVSAVACSGLEV